MYSTDQQTQLFIRLYSELLFNLKPSQKFGEQVGGFNGTCASREMGTPTDLWEHQVE